MLEIPAPETGDDHEIVRLFCVSAVEKGTPFTATVAVGLMVLARRIELWLISLPLITALVRRNSGALQFTGAANSAGCAKIAQITNMIGPEIRGLRDLMGISAAFSGVIEKKADSASDYETGFSVP